MIGDEAEVLREVEVDDGKDNSQRLEETKRLIFDVRIFEAEDFYFLERFIIDGIFEI